MESRACTCEAECEARMDALAHFKAENHRLTATVQQLQEEQARLKATQALVYDEFLKWQAHQSYSMDVLKVIGRLTSPQAELAKSLSSLVSTVQEIVPYLQHKTTCGLTYCTNCHQIITTHDNLRIMGYGVCEKPSEPRCTCGLQSLLDTITAMVKSDG